MLICPKMRETRSRAGSPELQLASCGRDGQADTLRGPRGQATFIAPWTNWSGSRGCAEARLCRLRSISIWEEKASFYETKPRRPLLTSGLISSMRTLQSRSPRRRSRSKTRELSEGTRTRRAKTGPVPLEGTALPGRNPCDRYHIPL
jgi:hypothetical protein